jgi:hypothetical protein
MAHGRIVVDNALTISTLATSYRCALTISGHVRGAQGLRSFADHNISFEILVNSCYFRLKDFLTNLAQ